MRSSFVKLYIALLLYLTSLVLCAGEDFYDLLGVSRQATDREIRKAFKKIALEKHPDKNQDDPTAHDNFLKINRAYEVLKDDDLRKKYDLHGEDGLKQDGPSGRNYQSWNYYHDDFGIYDDDPEIITLSSADFDASVAGTGDVWFINFYSPQCSHCHHLAPTWREVARELEGVVRIGAVNCADSYMLCSQQGIRSYPSLMMYPEREKYRGDKSTKQLLKYALGHVRSEVHTLWSGNFDQMVHTNNKLPSRPWLITYCGDGGDCLEKSTGVKLAAMLDELVHVGTLDCEHNAKLCGMLGVEYGQYYYAQRPIKAENAVELTSLDARELMMQVLNHMPDVKKLDSTALQSIQKNLKARQDNAWLIHFVDSETSHLELRKLPAFLGTMNVGRVDCRTMRTVCNDLYVYTFPSFLVFKVGGGYEVHHGRHTAHDIAAFAKDSVQNSVTVLGPRDFPERVVESRDPWFVDFFAPWCPPCMRLLPEFRKASKHMNQVRFGTVDCTLHPNLCQMYNVHSYPTTVFYNESIPHLFGGQHHYSHIVEFIRDTLKPPLPSLSPVEFERLVNNKRKEEIWLVDFFVPTCPPCMQLAPEWRKMAKLMADMPNFKVAEVNCQKYNDFCSQRKVTHYPSIFLYPAGTTKAAKFHAYTGRFRDAASMRAWAFEFLPSAPKQLTWSSFQTEVLGGKDPWIIDYYSPWCGHCRVFAPEFSKVAEVMEGRVHAAKVDCQVQQWLCQQAQIQFYPTVRFYQADSSKTTNIIGEQVDSQNAEGIIAFLNKKVKAKEKQRTKDEL